jgi:hypothetical protein
MMSRASFSLVIAGALAVSSAGCKDEGKQSAQAAADHAAMLADTATKDVGEIERGLPEGAKRLAPLFGKDDPRSNLPGVRKELQRIRRDVPDLLIAKSTFFALADDKGIAIRNDLEQDAMANQNLAQLFPELGKALSSGNYVTTTGSFPGPPGPAGPDKDWIAASPVKKEDGKVAGLLVTGWTYRAFARHLQEILKRDLTEKARAAGDPGKLPVIYVGVFDPSGVYFAPLTPKVNEDEMAKQNLVEKTASGGASSPLPITGRTFGWGAKRVEKLGPNTGVVVLRSEI